MTLSDDRYEIEVQVEVGESQLLPVDRMRQAIAQTLVDEAVEQGSITVVVSTDDAVQRLNREFRGIDKPTDILSFPADSSGLPAEAEMTHYLGDLIVALPYVERQAEQAGHSVADELVLAVIHGTLHLLGYDHDTAVHQREMWSRQAALLGTLEVAIEVPEYSFDETPDDVDFGH